MPNLRLLKPCPCQTQTRTPAGRIVAKLKGLEEKRRVRRKVKSSKSGDSAKRRSSVCWEEPSVFLFFWILNLCQFVLLVGKYVGPVFLLVFSGDWNEKELKKYCGSFWLCRFELVSVVVVSKLLRICWLHLDTYLLLEIDVFEVVGSIAICSTFSVGSLWVDSHGLSCPVLDPFGSPSHHLVPVKLKLLFKESQRL